MSPGGSRACAPARRRGGPPPTSECPQHNAHRQREGQRCGKEMTGAHSGSQTPAEGAGEERTARTQGARAFHLAARDRSAHAATRPSSATFPQLLHVIDSARVRRPAVCSVNNFQQRQQRIVACTGATKVQRRTNCGNEHHATVGSTASGQSDRPAPERAHRARNQSVPVCRLHCVERKSHDGASGARVPAR